MCLDERLLILEDVEILMDKWENRGVFASIPLHELLCLMCEESLISYKGSKVLALADMAELINDIFESLEYEDDDD